MGNTMGNLLSSASNDRVYACDQCGYWSKSKQRLQAHRPQPCTGTVDNRFKHSSGTVPITAAPTTDPSTQDDTDAAAAEEQLHAAISQELGQYIQATGDLVHPDVLAGLASTIAGVMANGEQRVS